MDFLNNWLRTAEHVDNPPERPRKPAGLVTVTFLKSFPGKRVMDERVGIREGDSAGFPAVVAAELARARYVEYAKDAA